MMKFCVLFMICPLYCAQYLSSEDILRNAKKAHPDRTYVRLSGDDFDKYAVISNHTSSFKVATMYRNESFVAKGIRPLGEIYDQELFLMFPRQGEDFYLHGFQLNLWGWYRRIDMRHYMLPEGYVCASTVQGFRDTQRRERVYQINNYLSLNSTHGIDTEDANCPRWPGGPAKLIGYWNVWGNLSAQMREMHDFCWDPKNADKYCVHDWNENITVVVPRKLPLYHALDATVYAECCGEIYECDKNGSRCSYFIYDHLNGVDYYLDDQSEWTVDNFKQPLFLVPEITNTTKFHTITRKEKITTTTAPETTESPKTPQTSDATSAVTTTSSKSVATKTTEGSTVAPQPTPITIAPQPSPNCCGGFSFFFGAIFG